MASLSDFFGGGGGFGSLESFGMSGIPGMGPGTELTGNTITRQISPTSDPAFAQLLEQIINITPTALPGINDIVSGGMNSPLLQLVLGPALARLAAPQAQQRQQLTEATRAAGGLRGSQYGKDFTRLQQQQGQQQNDLMAQVIQQMLAPLISGSLQAQQNSMLPGKSLTDVLRLLAPQTVSSQMGGSGGGGGGGGISPRTSAADQSRADEQAQIQRAHEIRLAQMRGGGGGDYRPPPNVPAASTSLGGNFTPYLDPYSGGGGFPTTYNQYTGSYETYNPNPTGFFTPEQGGPTEGIEQVTEGWW